MKKIALTFGLVWALLDPGGAVAAGDWTWPVRGPVITPYRNGDDPYAAGQHRGIDIAAPVGAAVVASTSGTVMFAGVAGSSGLTVAERTADGGYEVSYLHLSQASVHKGDHVDAGERLGAVGITGRRSAEQPHLHFGVRDAGARQSYRDPLDFLAPVPPAEQPQPRPAPVPVAAPARPEEHPGPAVAPPAPAGAPVPVGPPVRLPQPLRLPGRSHAPASRPQPAVRRSPVARAPRGAVHVLATRAMGPAQASLRSPAASHHASASASRPGHVASPRLALHGPAAAPQVPSMPAGQAARSHVAARPRHDGIDPAWLVACLGLVAAAVALGRPRRGRPRTTVVSLLRPLLRRS